MNQPAQEEGISIVLTAPQLLSALKRQSINQGETLSNRMWASLEITGGILEIIGAGALCVTPEPTGVTKVGCVMVGAHGADTLATGMHKLWTGQDTRTLTTQGATKLAEKMKVDPNRANNIGLSVDIGVSFGLASIVGALRASSITIGRVNLLKHEAKSIKGPGGHTIAKHVGKTEEQLRQRLAKEPRRTIVSTFKDLDTAEWAATQTIQQNIGEIQLWLKSSRERLNIYGKFDRHLGYGVTRETKGTIPLKNTYMGLKKEKYNGMTYYILTTYLTH